MNERSGASLFEAGVEALPSAIRYAAYLLHVQVEQITGRGMLVAAHRLPRDAMQPRKPVEPGPLQHGVHRRPRYPQSPADRVRPQVLGQAEGANDAFQPAGSATPAPPGR